MGRKKRRSGVFQLTGGVRTRKIRGPTHRTPQRVAASYEEALDEHSRDGYPRIPGRGAYGLAIPLYGNYCGPGHQGPGAPVDALDEICRQHDIAYDWKPWSEADRAVPLKVWPPEAMVVTGGLKTKGYVSKVFELLDEFGSLLPESNLVERH